MSAQDFGAFKVLLLNEWRLRSRRLGTVIALLLMLGLSWLMVAAPVDNTAMLVANNTRVLGTSAALSLGSAALLAPLLALLGFFLLRGRMAEDLRSGVGQVIAATQVGNGLFLASRWLAGVAYLGGLTLAFMVSTMAYQVKLGEGPLQPLLYLQNYALVLLPLLGFIASCALLFDSVPMLMGKAGDFLYFVFWVAMLAMIGIVDEAQRAVHPVVLLDFTGLLSSVGLLTSLLHTQGVNVGLSSFDPKLTPLTLLSTPWPLVLIGMRVITLALTLLPVYLAARLFHRYSPDRVKLSAAAKRRSPLALINTWLRPLSRLVQPLFRLAARLPGLPGQVLADAALSLAASPASILALLLSLLASSLAPESALPSLLIVIGGFWGVLISEISSRDIQAGCEELGGSVPGGALRRFVRQLAASCLLGLLFMGLLALRASALNGGTLSLAVLSGVFSLSAVAALLGHGSRSARTFLSLFLLGLYIALNARDLALLDVLGFNGAATLSSIGTHLSLGLLAAAAGLGLCAYQSRRR
ncbi:hypothetical protein WG899_06220 [Paucibacter sp. AS339]|uniref:hypothetical protein n=1 Tax=Paucibacter hankyongi TaxID=3133434 RepID=UPI0030AFA7AF